MCCEDYGWGCYGRGMEMVADFWLAWEMPWVCYLEVDLMSVGGDGDRTDE